MTTPSLHAIRETVARFYGLTADVILSGASGREVVEARHVGIYLARARTDSSLESIARRFGRKGHTSGIYSVNRVERKLGSDRDFQKRVALLDQAIGGRPDQATRRAGPIPAFAPFARRTLREAVKDVLAADDAVAIATGAAAARAARRKLEAALKSLRAAFENTPEGLSS